MESKFGTVEVNRLSYEAPGVPSLHPKDAGLNLPSRLFSHGVTKQVAYEAAKGSFDEVVDSLTRTTHAQVGKRQAEQLAVETAVDFDKFYELRSLVELPLSFEEAKQRLIVISADGKGVAMVHDDLREGTRKAAELEAASGGRSGRLAPGEKHFRKRRANVLSVYEVMPHIRTPEMLVSMMRDEEAPPRPDALRKRVWASLEMEQPEALDTAFDEALRRDPKQEQNWVALVDGEHSQLTQIKDIAQRRGLKLTMVLDIIHVLEYLWKAGKAMKIETRKHLEVWLEVQLFRVLHGAAPQMSKALKDEAKRRLGKIPKAVAVAARYIRNHLDMMDYGNYLAEGLPIASGVIEGACRHLIGDRLERTGARWSLMGAEAVLRLRALYASRDFDEYWTFHEQCELERNHTSKYAESLPPNPTDTEEIIGRYLRIVTSAEVAP